MVKTAMGCDGNVVEIDWNKLVLSIGMIWYELDEDLDDIISAKLRHEDASFAYFDDSECVQEIGYMCFSNH